jgi:hypothetical protein
MLEGKKLEHKPTMEKLADVKPEERRRAEEWMAKEPKQLINDLIVPALARNIDEIKALKLRVKYLEIEAIMLAVVLLATAICAAL